MTLANGAYHLYIDAKLPPIICEVQYGWVWEVGEPGYRSLSSYRGKFVRLVEAQEPDPPHGFYAGTNPRYAPEPADDQDSPEYVAKVEDTLRDWQAADERDIAAGRVPPDAVTDAKQKEGDDDN